MARFALVSLAVTLLACGFDTGGVMSGSVSNSVGGDDDTGAADDVNVEEGPGSGQEADGETSDPSATSASSNPTSDGDPTTDPTGDGTTAATDASAGTSTGAIDPSTSSGMIDPSTDASDGGTPDDPQYPNCNGVNTCASADQDCLQFSDINMVVMANVCMPPCSVSEDCPPPATGNAVPFCELGFCRLSCNLGETCPSDMTCHEVMGPELCAYDLP